MLECSKQKEIIRKLKYIKYNFVQQLAYLDYADAKEYDRCLTEIMDECKSYFPTNSATYYVEIIQGMKTALQVLCKGSVEKYGFQDIQKLLIELIDSTILDLKKEKNKKEVFFLPYKLDMWDSLESIWKELSADKEFFNTYVMPIPWAERNPDGSVKKWHCEINEFSKHVPVIDYRKVDLAGVKPDVIFIHNPYDGNNVVTSVDERYYSDKLKQYTDTLIYVPYFVVGDNINPDKCHSPAIRYADYVIVQDENIKNIYEKNYPWGESKEKFLPLGSPKIDKVLNSKKEDYVIPIEWKRRLKGKKVILYNTSIHDMMYYDEFYIEKLKSVFSYFNKLNDTVLWWRPHPLLKSSMSVLRPELYDDYCALEQKYKKNNWGIYDDSTDVHRAIICTDAYYGDNSSLIWLYEKTGKVIMKQEFRKIEEEEHKGLSTYFYTTDGVKSWVIYYWQHTPYLWEINNRTGEAVMLLKLPVKDYGFYNYGCLIYFDDNLFIFPWQGRGMIKPLKYDFHSNKLDEIETKIPQLDAVDWCWFSEFPIVIGERMFVVSNKGNILLEYDKMTKKWNRLKVDLGQVQVELFDVYKDKIILFRRNELGVMDSNTLEIKWKLIPSFTQSWRISIVDDKMWIISVLQDEILVYDFLDETIIRAKLPCDENKYHMFFTVVPYGKEVLLLSGYKECSLILSLKKGKIKMEKARFYTEKNLGKQYFSDGVFGERFGAVKIISNDWFTISGDGSKLFYCYKGVDYKVDIHINDMYVEIMKRDLKNTLGKYKMLTDDLSQLIYVINRDDNEYVNDDKTLCCIKIKEILRGF